MASDDGWLGEIDRRTRLVRKERLGMDLEDICAIGKDLYVLDESLRLVYVLDEDTWKRKAIHPIDYHGARNLGPEAITYMPEVRHFIVVSEKLPILLMETDENFTVLNQVELHAMSDISSVTYHDHRLWLLSDEDHAVFEMNPDGFTIEKRWNLPVYNPEGICFDDGGTLRIVSDDCRRLYTFPGPEAK